MFRKLRLATVLVLLGLSLNHLPIAVRSAASQYASYQEWRLENKMKDLSQRIEFGQKVTHSEGYEPYPRDDHLLIRAAAYLEIAQEAKAEGDDEAAWKAVRLSQDRIESFEKCIGIK